MRFGFGSATWWGPPKKFGTHEKDRRVSWLELFYDLVYVIAISRITHHFSHHISFEGLLEYAYLFMLIFWGWLNGSLYHDLHGSEGLRTRLMTLWQMLIIAALAITLELSPEKAFVNSTIVFMIMQLFITYLWWSVGLYDPNHRRLNRPYTILFLTTLGLMAGSLFADESWRGVIGVMILLCNFSPPFITNLLLRRTTQTLDLSPSMLERLGLFTIIVFGELVLGVVNGIGETHTADAMTWVHFALALSVVFTLWWIFFTLISNRQTSKGFVKASILELLFIPALITLGLIASCFASFFEDHADPSLQKTLSYSIAIFLMCVSLIMGLLTYPKGIQPIKRSIRISLLSTAVIFFLITLIHLHLPGLYYLILILLILLVEVTYINVRYYRLNLPGIPQNPTGETEMESASPAK